MLLEHIRFKKRQTLKIEIKTQNEISLALQKLGLGENRPVIVVVGGAGGIREEDWESIQDGIGRIAQSAQENNAAVIDGGTDSGIMAAMGNIRTKNEYSFPLIGVAAEGTVKWPGRKLSVRERLSFNRDACMLDPNHTHFILVPGKNWGDESSWIAAVATQLAGEQSSLAILINGGMISREKDIPNNIKAGRAVLVLEGTGRAADEFATRPPKTDLMPLINISELDRLAEELKHHLKPAT